MAATELSKANTSGLALLEELLGTDAITPVFLAESKSIVFLEIWRGGVVAGAAHGSGFALTKNPDGSWSAPCFVTLSRYELGMVFGFESDRVLMSAATSRGIDNLVAGWCGDPRFKTGMALPKRHFTFFSSSHVQDVGWATASVRKGAFVDFSWGVGALGVDSGKNTSVYGDAGPSASDILSGKVQRPVELQPLYAKIAQVTCQ